jgi:ParB-like chromosome segregation protein Spo0J
MTEPIIDQEFDNLLRPLSHDEFEGLEKNCLKYGVLDPLKVWNGILIDGKHRLKIAKKHGLQYTTTEMPFADRDEAKLWILSHQIDRRNVGESAIHSLRARVIATMQSAGATISEIAEKLEVAPRTVHRARECANIIEQLPEDLQQRISEGSLIASVRSLQQYVEMDDIERAECIKKVRDNPDKALHHCMPVPKKVKPILPPEQMDVINENFSGKTRQLLSVGAIEPPSAADVRAIEKLTPVQKKTLDQVLATRGANSIKQGLDILDLAKKKPTLPVDAQKINERISDMSIKLIRLFDDLAAAMSATSSPEHQDIIDSMKITLSKWRAWTNYSG